MGKPHFNFDSIKVVDLSTEEEVEPSSVPDVVNIAETRIRQAVEAADCTVEFPET